MELMDYIIIGYLVILFFITGYLRRDLDNKLKINLSYSFLLSACLSTLGFFGLFYLVEFYQNYYLIYFIISFVLLTLLSLLTYLKYRNEK